MFWQLQQDRSKYQPNTLVVGMFDQFFIPPEVRNQYTVTLFITSMLVPSDLWR